MREKIAEGRIVESTPLLTIRKQLSNPVSPAGGFRGKSPISN